MKFINNKINLETVFFISVFLYFLYTFIMAIRYSITQITSIKSFFLIIPIILFFVFLFYINKKEKNKSNFKFYLLILIFVTLFIKILNLFLLAPSIVQTSDFGVHLNNAVSDVKNFSNTAHFYHWALLSKTFQFFSLFFGKTQLSAITFISFVSLLNTVLLYWLSYLITHKTKAAFIISLLYVFWPSNILYTNLFSTEHIAIFLILLITIIFIYLINNIDNYKLSRNLLLAIILGISLSLLKFFKPVSIILIIAGVIYLLFYNFLYIEKRTINIKKIGIFLSVLVVYSVLNFGIFSYLDNLVGTRVNRNPSSFYIYMGLSPTNKNLGMYSDEIVKKYNDYYNKSGKDFEKTGNMLIADFKKEYASNFNKIYGILKNKNRASWETDVSALSWVNHSIKNKDKLFINYDLFDKIGSIVSQTYYVIIILLFIIGLISCITNRNKYLFFTNLFIFGFALLLLIGETQGRYKIITYPFIVVQAFYGLNYISNKFKLGVKK